MPLPHFAFVDALEGALGGAISKNLRRVAPPKDGAARVGLVGDLEIAAPKCLPGDV